MVKGSLTFPGDKSISHRALILASLTDGHSNISNLSTGMDVRSTRRCLESCGIQIWDEGGDVMVKGGHFTNPENPLDCGNSGTTTRLLLGLLAGQGIHATIVGDESLSSRPMNRILNPLTQMGLKAESNHGRLPVTIYQSKLTGIRYLTPIASAQIKSAILLAGLGAENQTSVTESILTRNHTETMLQELGAPISITKLTTTISYLSYPLSPMNLTVPGDPSTAAFFAGAAALVPGSVITLEKILINPTRTGFFDAMKRMGADIQYLDQWSEAGERIGNLKITHKPLSALNVSGNKISSIVDEIPILAILATQAKGKTEIRDAGELRIKECDRIHAICTNLNKMGADIQERDDGLIIHGPTPLTGTKIETFNDHRIAMAFSIAGLITLGQIQLDNPDCASISYPEFYSELEKVTV